MVISILKWMILFWSLDTTYHTDMLQGQLGNQPIFYLPNLQISGQNNSWWFGLKINHDPNWGWSREQNHWHEDWARGHPGWGGNGWWSGWRGWVDESWRCWLISFSIMFKQSFANWLSKQVPKNNVLFLFISWIFKTFCPITKFISNNNWSITRF